MKLSLPISPLNSLYNAAKIIKISAVEPEKWRFEVMLVKTIENEKNEVKNWNIKSLATNSYVCRTLIKFGT